MNPWASAAACAAIWFIAGWSIGHWYGCKRTWKRAHQLLNAHVGRLIAEEWSRLLQGDAPRSAKKDLPS